MSYKREGYLTRELDNGEEIEIFVTYNVTPGSSDYFSHIQEQWYPGDPPEVEIVHAKDAKGNEIELTDEEEDQIFKQAFD